MIEVEHIIDGNKSLFTIIFDRSVMKHMGVKCDDSLNFFQSKFKCDLFTLFKADTGYRITRCPNRKKMYQINVMQKIETLKEFSSFPVTYYLKKNGIIRFFIKEGI